MDDTPAEIVFGRYRLLDLLGQGGMGKVYRAYDTETDRVVAIKVLPAHLADDQSYQQRFGREARIAAGLSDPHVVPIHGFGEIDGRLYVDMRLIEGRELGRFMREHSGRLTPATATWVIDQVASALDGAHRAGLVHRDVKPSNILVAEPSTFAYLIDFGLARGTTDPTLTDTGQTMGTMTYLSPERLRGITDARSDVYALACVLYECLTGKRPFPGVSVEEQIAAHLTSAPPRPSVEVAGVPAAFDAVIARGMAKDPEQRFQTAGELARAATAALAGQPPLPAPTAPPLSRLETPRSHRLLITGIVVGSMAALVAVAALVVHLVLPRTPSVRTPSAPPRAPVRPTSTAEATGVPLPRFLAPADLGDCSYHATSGAAGKAVKLPASGKVSTDAITIPVMLTTTAGDIGLDLDPSMSPCAVNSFTSLVQQGFLDGGRCFWLTTDASMATLECGDPNNDGTGGPGYQFADEYPADQYPPGTAATTQPTIYPRGTLAMASSQPDTNGSQFFLVYQDSPMLPQYTIFGQITGSGLAVLDSIAHTGVDGGGTAGPPATDVTVTSARLGR